MGATSLMSLLVGVIIGMIGFLIYRRLMDEKKLQSAEKEAERIVNRAKSQVAKIERDAQSKAKDFETRARKNVEAEIRREKQKIQSVEQQLKEKEQRMEKDARRKEDQLNQKLKDIDEHNSRLTAAEGRVKETEEKVVSSIRELERKLESAANMTADQAKAELIATLTEEARREAAGRLQHIEDEAKQDADRKARRILAVAISRYASEVATERTVSSIPLTGEEMKGKIIGREGRNIRALESACGVDLIIDETPETVIISSFDPVRREIALRALEKLMEDGRVHPARIEEVVDKVKAEIQANMREDGEKACFELGVHNVHSSIITVLGSLKYRQADGQNLLQHTIEVATLAGLMAQEIGVDAKLVRRAALLHAIGRGLDHNSEGSYSQAGAEFARKHGEKEDVVHAIRAHNEEIAAVSTLDHLLQAAFNLAKSRPGARRANMESFIRRLSDLESVANSFDGVAKSYAIQSGKEIRVIVDSGKVTDEQAVMLSRDIARKIERESNYSGQIRVAVVRETRLVEHAR